MSWQAGALTAAALIALIAGARLAQDAGSGTASWDATRAAGFAGYVLVWTSVETGIALHLRWRPGGTAMTWMLELHRIASTLALAFVVGHVFGLLIDPVVRFEAWEAAVPLLGPYRPVQVTLGAVALWLIAAVLITTAVADRLPYAAWRRSHYLAFPAYALSLLHGLTSGTDSGSPPALALYAGTASIVAATLVWRAAGRGWTTAAEREF